MAKKDSSKVFRTAFNKMLELYLEPEAIFVDDIAKQTGVSGTTIYAFKKGDTNLQVNKLEKILLSEIISEEALTFFIQEVGTLLKCYRNHSYSNEGNVKNNAEIEDAILDGSQDRKKNLLNFDRIVTPENFRRDNERKERIGHEGEKCVNVYLQDLKDEGKIDNFKWVSKQHVKSPCDFLVSIDGNYKNYIDVKSTSEGFGNKIYISQSELELMSSETGKYDIYRIFHIDENNRTAKLRIAEDVRSFAQGIIEVFKGLPEGVWADGICVDLSKSVSGLDFKSEREIQLPDEPEEESEDI